MSNWVAPRRGGRSFDVKIFFTLTCNPDFRLLRASQTQSGIEFDENISCDIWHPSRVRS